MCKSKTKFFHICVMNMNELRYSMILIGGSDYQNFRFFC